MAEPSSTGPEFQPTNRVSQTMADPKRNSSDIAAQFHGHADPIDQDAQELYFYADSFAARPALVGSNDTSLTDDQTVEPNDDSTLPGRIMAGFSVLASAAAILTGLRRLSVFTTESTQPDVEQLVQHLCRGRLLARMPRRLIKSWGRSIHVILDRHRRLATYWNDQDYVVRALRRVYPRDGFQVSVLAEGSGELRLCEPRREVGHRLPQSGTTRT